MTRNLKALGLALVAVFAVSAISASAAMAEETKPVASFTASKYPAKITGTQVEEHKFTIGTAGEVKCKKSHFHAELTEKSTSLTVHPTYEECTFKFGAEENLPVTVTMHECYYTFTVHAGSVDNWTGQVHVICPNAGEKIEIHVWEIGANHATDPTRCTFTVQPQTINTGISYENMTAAGTVTVNAEEAPTTVEKSSGTLGKCGPGGALTAKYTGKVEATGKDSEEKADSGSIVAGM